MTFYRPRVLDASALVELFNGHPRLMALLGDAAAGDVNLAVPSVAVAEAQAVLAAAPTAWDHIMAHPGMIELPLSAQAAIEVGNIARPRLEHHPVHKALIGPIMVAQVLREAIAMNAVIVTRVPEA